MDSHVAAMAAEVERLVDQRVPETTRLALQENAEMKARLSELSEQARLVMKEKSALQDRKSRLSADVDVLEEMLSELTRKSCVRKKVRGNLSGLVYVKNKQFAKNISPPSGDRAADGEVSAAAGGAGRLHTGASAASLRAQRHPG